MSPETRPLGLTSYAMRPKPQTPTERRMGGERDKAAEQAFKLVRARVLGNRRWARGAPR